MTAKIIPFPAHKIVARPGSCTHICPHCHEYWTHSTYEPPEYIPDDHFGLWCQDCHEVSRD